MSITVKDALGANQVIETPAVAGRAAATASKPVVLSNEDTATVGALTETAPASDTASSGLNGRLQRIAQRLTSMIALLPTALGAGGGLKVDGSGTALPVSVPTDPFGANADAASATGSISAKLRAIATALGVTALDLGSGTGGTRTIRTIVDSSQLAALGQAAMASSMPVAIANNQSGLANRAISAAFTTLTRPANTTAYTAADSISDNATAGSVTALSATLSDVNDDPIFISEILVNSTDTGLAGKKVRAYLYNSDPTASTGVGGGDNAAFSNKKAGYIGSFMGWMETGFSDGTVGRLVPTFNETNNTPAGGYVVTKPTAGAKTLFIQYQAVEAFTPSANSTTIIGTARGWQGRAA